MSTFLPTARETQLRIQCADVVLDGDLTLPSGTCRGVVIFAHGSGSSRTSPRNRLVASAMQRRSLATLLFDLLSPEEAAIDARTGELRFNISFLTRRLIDVVLWAESEAHIQDLGIGLFGSSTGAAAALAAASKLPQIQAVVSRGGRTDLAQDIAHKVESPTLLLVGAQDEWVLEANRATLPCLAGEKKLMIIHGASHLFEEPGTLERVAELAAQWFETHLSTRQPNSTHRRP